MDSFLKRVFVIAGKHTTVHGVHHAYKSGTINCPRDTVCTRVGNGTRYFFLALLLTKAGICRGKFRLDRTPHTAFSTRCTETHTPAIFNCTKINRNLTVLDPWINPHGCGEAVGHKRISCRIQQKSWRENTPLLHAILWYSPSS